MPLLASSHAALETGDESSISIFPEDIDDLLLSGVCLFHFVLRGQAGISKNMREIVLQTGGAVMAGGAMGAPLATPGC